MSATRSRRRSRSRSQDVLQKPAGTIHPRVQQVGPEHFGIVSVDCAKKRSKWMLADFFGKVTASVPERKIAITTSSNDARKPDSEWTVG